MTAAEGQSQEEPAVKKRYAKYNRYAISSQISSKLFPPIFSANFPPQLLYSFCIANGLIAHM